MTRFFVQRTARWLLLIDAASGLCERAYEHAELDRALAVAARLNEREGRFAA